jgi:hypothetical protein
LVRLTPPSILETSYGAAKTGVSFGADRNNPGRFSSLYRTATLYFDMPVVFGASEDSDVSDEEIFIADDY